MDGLELSHGLTEFFVGIDYPTLWWLHEFARLTDGAFTGLMSIISLLTEKGIAMFFLGIILMVIKRTRIAGLCVFGALCCGALMTNIILKDLIARPRPFLVSNSLYYSWWRFIGAPEESGYSFPSGHVTAITAGMTALFLTIDKRKTWVGYILVFLTGLSRCYLMVHYPSDILSAVLVGAVAAGLSLFVTRNIFYLYAILDPRRKKRLDV